MKTQDKEELQYKQTDRENDQDGMIAARLREKLIAIMKSYNLLDIDGEQQNKYGKPEKFDKYSKDKADYHNNKVGTFKDKKLNRLWDKAEMAGFTPDELVDLKKEFAHYEEKLEIYYKLYDDLDQKIKDRSRSKFFFCCDCHSSTNYASSSAYLNRLLSVQIRLTMTNSTFSTRLCQTTSRKTHTRNICPMPMSYAKSIVISKTHSMAWNWKRKAADAESSLSPRCSICGIKHRTTISPRKNFPHSKKSSSISNRGYWNWATCMPTMSSARTNIRCVEKNPHSLSRVMLWTLSKRRLLIFLYFGQ